MTDLKTRRKTARLTMRDMAERSGLRLTQYAAIEGNHRSPTTHERVAIENALRERPK